MKYGYISKIDSVKEFQRYITLFEQKGISADDVVINLSFDKFVASLTEGDAVVVCSYIGLFTSLGAYLTAAIELHEKGIAIESLLEPNICINCSNIDLIRELSMLNCQLHSTSSLKSINRLKNEGKQLGRPRGSISSELRKKIIQVDKLRKESNITIINACKVVGCNYRTYYRVKTQTSVQPNTK